MSEALAGLRELHAELAADMRERWDRDLPLGELVGDRWERARRLSFGEGANIYDSAHVVGDVRVGADTWIGPFTILDGQRAPLTIGAGCSISAGVQIYTHDAVHRTLTGGASPFDVGPVSIGDRTYVGPQSLIARGVTIGHHCVIGAQSFVNADLPPFSVAYGAPARVRGRVELRDDGTVEIVALDR